MPRERSGVSGSIGRAIRGRRPAAYSAFDLQIIFRILAINIIWKILSVDYSALPGALTGTKHHDLLPHWLDSAVGKLEPVLFSSSFDVMFLQFLIAILFSAFVLFPSRIVLALAIVPAVLTEWTVWKLRGDLFDSDFSLALLILVCVWPGKWRWSKSWDRNPDIVSTRLGL